MRRTDTITRPSTIEDLLPGSLVARVADLDYSSRNTFAGTLKREQIAFIPIVVALGVACCVGLSACAHGPNARWSESEVLDWGHEQFPLGMTRTEAIEHAKGLGYKTREEGVQVRLTFFEPPHNQVLHAFTLWTQSKATELDLIFDESDRLVSLDTLAYGTFSL